MYHLLFASTCSIDAMLRCDRTLSLKDCACADLVLLRRLFDLKSHNVLLTRDGTAKIADVGLAKVLTQVWERGSPLPLHHCVTMRCACPSQSSAQQCKFHGCTCFSREHSTPDACTFFQLLSPWGARAGLCV